MRGRILTPSQLESGCGQLRQSPIYLIFLQSAPDMQRQLSRAIAKQNKEIFIFTWSDGPP